MRSVIALLAALALLACGPEPSPTPTEPAGGSTTSETEALKAGAAVMQDTAPVDGLTTVLDGFHPMKDDPSHQVEAHHYCRQVNEDFAQCALFDGSGADANLVGVEYIISGALYAGLPDGEKSFWHPHDYEIASGLLVAPGLPEPAEDELMRKKLGSYGKTWHLWSTGLPGAPGDELPMGPPMLAWSFTADGQIRPPLVQQRDRRLGRTTDEVRKHRADAGLAR